MPKKKGKEHIRVTPKVWDQVFDHKLALELTKRKNISMSKAVEDLLRIKRLNEFAYWFEINSEKLGIKLDPYYSLNLSLCYPVEKDGKEIDVALVVRTSDLTKIYQEPAHVDLVICLEEDAKIDIPTIVVDIVEFESKIPYTFYISKQLYAKLRKYKPFNWAKFIQEMVTEKLKELQKKGE